MGPVIKKGGVEGVESRQPYFSLLLPLFRRTRMGEHIEEGPAAMVDVEEDQEGKGTVNWT